MRLAVIFAGALFVAGCHSEAEADEPGDEAIANFHPAVVTSTAPVRTIDNAVIRDLGAGSVAGVYLDDLRRTGPGVRLLAAAERAEDRLCHDPEDTAAAGSACRRRDQLVAELKREGWCWGPDAEVEGDKRWMRPGAACHG